MRNALLAVLLALPTLSAAQEADRLKTIEDRLNKLEGAPAKTSPSAFNPAMGMALDLFYGHQPQDGTGNFEFRAAEVNLEAALDPFAKGWAIFTGSPDGVEVEEAAIKTTALPYNLTVTGGRLFTSFGRLAHFHDHELPVVERPKSLEDFIGGEAQADGLELNWLAPTPFYLNATFGAYNKLGAENDRAANDAPRKAEEFTYLGRLATYADLGADHSLELGVDSAWTPRRPMMEDTAASGSPDPAVTTKSDTGRILSGADLTYRYQPAAGGLYRGLLLATEIMRNDERRFDPATRLPTDRAKAWGGFTYLQVKLGRHWRPGVLVDYSEDLDNRKTSTRTYTGVLSYDVSEFQRLRLAYSRARDNTGGRTEDKIALQWTGVLGHHVHGFRDR